MHKYSRVLLFLVCCAVACAFFLRVYRIPEYMTFLSDQGRDAIILRRIVTLEKWPLTGPTTSIGNVFTGPFFYYLTAPFMRIAGMDPAGPAYGIAFINTVLLVIGAYFVFRTFGWRTATIFFALVGFSYGQITQSRFSWNPNPVSGWSFLTLACWYFIMISPVAIDIKRYVSTLPPSRTRIGTFLSAIWHGYRWYIVYGLMLGLALQLHYITLLLILPFAIERIWSLVTSSQHSHTKQISIGLMVCIVAFLSTFTPLILFDLRHDFVNLHTLLRATQTGEVRAVNILYSERVAQTLISLWQHALGISLSFAGAVCVSLALIFTTVLAIRGMTQRSQRIFLYGMLSVWVMFVPLFALLETGRHLHYYNHLYYSLYLCIAVSGAFLFSSRRGTLMLGLGIGAYIWLQLIHCRFLFEPSKPYYQTKDAQLVAAYILSQSHEDTYQVVGLPFYETEGHYRYYLEHLGKRPLPADTIGDPRELFVICHQLDKKDCEIPGNAQWQLAVFQNTHPTWTIQSTHELGGVRVYKLVP